ncbi:MAG: hypothetical protein HUJ26_21230 [Planctomycetaceae bacterium]|nr:hypothetical protein [Planctomycetaceae bacterium]
MRTLLTLSVLSLLLSAFVVAQDSQPVSRVLPATSQRNVFVQKIRLNSEQKLLTFPDREGGVLAITSEGHQNSRISLQRASEDLVSIRSATWERLPSFNPRKPRLSLSPALEPTNLTRNIDASQTYSRKSFFLHVTSDPLTSPAAYRLIHGDLCAEGDHVRVYLDSTYSESERYTELGQKIIHCLEESILPAAEKLAGCFADVDGDGKLSILLSPALDQLQGGKTSVKGFVRSSDFRLDVPRPFSNHCDVIYLNTECPDDTNHLTLLAHEYWHVLQFSYRLVRSHESLPIQEDWICEGSAHLAEQVLGGDGDNLTKRIECWLQSPEDSPLMVSDYYSSGLWRHDGCRGGAYLFFRWCHRNYGDQILSDLLTSPSRDHACLEELTGLPIDQLRINFLRDLLEERELESTLAPEDRLLNDHIFPDQSLTDLKVYELPQVSSVTCELAPTAQMFVRVRSGDRLVIRSDEPIHVQAVFLPDRQTSEIAIRSDSQRVRN